MILTVKKLVQLGFEPAFTPTGQTLGMAYKCQRDLTRVSV